MKKKDEAPCCQNCRWHYMEIRNILKTNTTQDNRKVAWTTMGTKVAWLCNKSGGNLYGCEVKDDDRCDKWEE